MPFRGLHTFRIKDPSGFDRFRTEFDAFGEGIRVIWGVSSGGNGGSSEVQSIRFDTDIFSKVDADAWLEAHDFAPIAYEAPLQDLPLDSEVSPIRLDCTEGDFAALELDPRPDGEPPNRFRKELIREGSWVHPITKKKFSIKKAMLERWISKFKEMAEANIKIPILKGHVETTDNGNGWLTDLSVEKIKEKGRSLWALFGQLDVGDDLAAKINDGTIRDVSVSVNDVVGSHEIEYKNVIDELSMTLWPVIREQSGFMKLAKTEQIGYRYEGPKKRRLWKSRDKGGSMKWFSGKGQIIEDEDGNTIDLAVVKEGMDRLEKIEAENKELKADLAAKSEVIQAARVAKLAETKGNLLAKVKGMVEEKHVSADFVTNLSAIVEKAFASDMTEDQATELSGQFEHTLAAVKLGAVPNGKLSRDRAKEEETDLDKQDLSAKVKERVQNAKDNGSQVTIK